MEPSPSSDYNMQNPQKRILPSRSRRGGPGVGRCDIDVMILETQKRKFENEPLIPVDTPFLLTTNSALVTISDGTDLGINIHANERYFDRPEVLKAYREQSIIQTPEFVNVADTPNVGGRFRPRGLEDPATDTSDATYEKRHRKYETFEKRQRLREKEKLKHEHYKLKERIEQLRAMDGSAFLTLPDSTFAQTQVVQGNDTEDDGSAALNGVDGHTEGERRRKEMLAVAMSLEARYRVLLPSEKMKKATVQTYGGLGSSSVEPEQSYNDNARSRDEAESELGEERFVQSTSTQNESKEVEKLKLKIKFPASLVASQSLSFYKPIKKSREDSTRASKKKRTSFSTTSSMSHISPYRSALKTGDIHGSTTDGDEVVAAPSPTPLDAALVTGTPISNPDIAILEFVSPDGAHASEEEDLEAGTPSTESLMMIGDSISARPSSRKKYRAAPSDSSIRAPSIPPIEFITVPTFRRSSSRQSSPQPSHRQNISSSGSGGLQDRPCQLLISATRSAGGKKSRGGARRVTAFGVKVPEGLSEPREYEIPYWLLAPPEQDGRIDEMDTKSDGLPYQDSQPAASHDEGPSMLDDVP